MKSETVEITRETITFDDDMDEIKTIETQTVENVIFGQPSTTDVINADREHGITIQYVCGFPTTFTGSLRGCVVKRGNGETYKVVGDPMPFDYNCPTLWNREVILGANDG